jgi:hypothetical protein
MPHLADLLVLQEVRVDREHGTHVRKRGGERNGGDEETMLLRVDRLCSIRQHTSAFVSIRQHTSAYVSIRQHTSAYVSIRQHTSGGDEETMLL